MSQHYHSRNRNQLGRRNYSFGAYDAQAESNFKSALNVLKEQLFNLYKNKTKLIADRETLRFQYITSWNQKWQNYYFSAINELMAAGKSEAIDLLKKYLSYKNNTIRMAKNMLGEQGAQYVNAVTFNYQQEPSFSLGSANVLKVDFLVPIENWLTKPYSNFETRPFYIYAKSSIMQKAMNPSQFYVYWGVVSFNLAGIAQTEGAPATLEYLKKFDKATTGISQYNEAKSLQNCQDVIDILNKSITGLGTFSEIWTQGKELYKSLVEKTLTIVTNQYSIDQVEVNILALVNQYKDQLSSAVAASDIYGEVLALSQSSNVYTPAVQTPVPQPMPVQTPVVQPQVTSQQTVVTTAPAGSMMQKGTVSPSVSTVSVPTSSELMQTSSVAQATPVLMPEQAISLAVNSNVSEKKSSLGLWAVAAGIALVLLNKDS